jgi:hypothetical protein
MTKRTIFVIVACALVVFVAAVVLGGLVSGGAKTFHSVATALENHNFIVGQVGTPVSIEKNDGPWKVMLGADGRRHGYYSITASGSKTNEMLKAYWQELSGGSVEVYAIYRTQAWAQDELVWGVSKPDSH